MLFRSETRVSMMPAFGKDQMLTDAEIGDVVAYVKGLSSGTAASQQTKAGETLFADNCAACHGADAKGDPTAGAPNLTDNRWIYGGDVQTIYTTVWDGRQGRMPTWEARLLPVERKILTLYLVDLMSANP